MRIINITGPKSFALSTKSHRDFTLYSDVSDIAIPEKIYDGNLKIQNAVFINDVGVIGPDAFHSAGNLSSFTASAKVICERAFTGCTKLKSFNFEKTQSIGESAFALSGIEKADFSNVKIIKDSAFSCCIHLKEIDLNNVEVVEHHAFESSGLLTVSFGAKLKKIGNQAFEGCSFLENIVCLTPNPPRICESTFNGVPIKKIWVVNSECLKAFKEAKYWSQYADRMEVIDWISVSRYSQSLKDKEQQRKDSISKFCKVN